jgi:xanthine dehydrogenase YagS FAD-binding subunit
MEGENKYHAIFGGNDCRIVHPSDTAPALVACDATVTLHSPAGDRTVPLEKFFTLPEVDVTRENVLGRDELLSEVRVPRPPARTRSAYLKAREKSSFDFALASCAAALTFDGNSCVRARLVLGGVAPIPWRCPDAESILVGHTLDATLVARAADAALAGATPLGKNRYKVSLAKGIIRRLLADLSRA